MFQISRTQRTQRTQLQTVLITNLISIAQTNKVKQSVIILTKIVTIIGIFFLESICFVFYLDL